MLKDGMLANKINKKLFKYLFFFNLQGFSMDKSINIKLPGESKNINSAATVTTLRPKMGKNATTAATTTADLIILGSSLSAIY